MKPLVIFFALLTGLSWAQEDPKTGATLTITLENVLSDEGDILAALHTGDTFMKGAGVANFKSEAKKGQMTFAFENVAPGTYAVSVLHDLNGNQQMDFQPGGMPAEPYAMSGNDMSMGPPSFDSVRFEVTAEDQAISVRF
jgi:uncharacterized protein (DUF2141 family)